MEVPAPTAADVSAPWCAVVGIAGAGLETFFGGDWGGGGARRLVFELGERLVFDFEVVGGSHISYPEAGRRGSKSAVRGVAGRGLEDVEEEWREGAEGGVGGGAGLGLGLGLGAVGLPWLTPIPMP